LPDAPLAVVPSPVRDVLSAYQFDPGGEPHGTIATRTRSKSVTMSVSPNEALVLAASGWMPEHAVVASELMAFRFRPPSNRDRNIKRVFVRYDEASVGGYMKRAQCLTYLAW